MADDSLSSTGKKRSSRKLLDHGSSEGASGSSPSTDPKFPKAKDKDKLSDKKKDSSKQTLSVHSRSDLTSSGSERPARPVRGGGDSLPGDSSHSLQVPKTRDTSGETEVRLEDLPSLKGVLNKWSGTFKGSSCRLELILLHGCPCFLVVESEVLN